MAELIMSAKEIVESLNRDNKIVSEAMERFLKGEIGAKELNEIGKGINKKTRELNRKLKEAEKALYPNAKV